jgi:hypothetical protein
VRIIFPRAAIMSAILACSLQGAEDAGKMLKVPPAGDRPVGGVAPATESKETQPAPSPSVSPPAEPEQTTPQAEAYQADASAEAIVPEPYPVSRYASLWENSPFQIESIAPPQQSEGLAQRFVLGGILHENGEPVVWVRERATQQSYKVARNSTNNVGLSLVEVSETMEKQSDAPATIRLGGELGVIKFDSIAAGSSPGMAMPPPMARPMTVPATGSRLPQPVNAASPQVATPNAPVSPSLPQQPGAYPAPGQAGVVPVMPGPGVPQSGQARAPGEEQMPPPRVIRRRAIVPSPTP